MAVTIKRPENCEYCGEFMAPGQAFLQRMPNRWSCQCFKCFNKRRLEKINGQSAPQQKEVQQMEISANTIMSARLAGLKAEAAILEAALSGGAVTNAQLETKAAAKTTKKAKEEKAEVADTSSVDLLSFDEETAVDEKPADKKTILKAAQDYANKEGMPAFAKLLKKYNAAKLQEVKEDDLQKLYKECKAALDAK